MMRYSPTFPAPRPSALAVLLAGVVAACAPESPPEQVPEAGTVFQLPTLAEADYLWIASRIYRNETGGEARYLTHWGAGEDFPSLGIGHFIWFPAGVDAPFDESFPALVDYLQQEGSDECLPMPGWLAKLRSGEFDAPWRNKATFDAALDSDELRALRQWLSDTAPQQARFIVAHFVQRWNRLELPADEKDALTGLLQRLVAVPQGLFAVIDYVNFKGLGTNPAERYEGHGWGLLQVLGDVAALEGADDEPLDLVHHFSAAAAARLANRAALAPPERDEARWVPGWTRRVSAYPAGPDARETQNVLPAGELPGATCDGNNESP